MNKKTVVLFAVTAVLAVAFVAGAVVLYNALSEENPAGSALRPPSGQPGGADRPPPGQGGGNGGNGNAATGGGNGEDGWNGGNGNAATGGGNGGNGEDSGQNGGTGTPPEGPGDGAGQPPDGEDDQRVAAPDFTVQDINGNDVKLSDLLGKPVVLNFWASWCPPCKREMPDFNVVFEELGDDIHFMMVCMVDGARETKETGAAFIADSGYTFPIYFDIRQEASILYGVRSIPTSMFIDSGGYIITKAEGSIDEDTLRLGISYITG